MNTDDIAIKAEGLYKSFKLPHEKSSSIKGAVIKFWKKKKGYEKQHVLKGINFEIKKGEFFGIVGRNGSGKSTLLKLLAGVYTPDKGLIKINGSLTPFIELGVGFNPELTGRENVFLNGALLGFNRKDMSTMYDDIVTFAELERFMDQKLKNYSSGMQVRLAFSIAIRARSDILLLDEVLAVGDASFQKKCFDYFRELKKNNQTVVLISHDMNAVREYCDKAMLIEKGEIINVGTPESVAREYTKLFLNSSEIKESKTDNRWGTEKAKIKKITADNLMKENIKISIECEFNEPVEDPLIGFYIRTPIGIKLIETNTQWLHIKAGSFQAHETALITWTVPNIFTNGINSITVAIANSDGSEYFDWWEDAHSFIIDKDEITTALTLPNQKLQIERQKK